MVDNSLYNSNTNALTSKLLEQTKIVKATPQKINPKLQKLRDFCYSDWFLFISAFFVVLGWAVDIPHIPFVVLILQVTFVLFVCDDFTPLLGIIIIGPNLFSKMILNDLNSFLASFLPMFGLLALVVVAMVYNIVRYPRSKFRLGKMFYPQLAVSIVLILGGAFTATSEEYLNGLGSTLGLGVAMLAVYLLFNNLSKYDNTQDRALYFAKAMTWLGVVIVAQIFIFTIKAGVPLQYRPRVQTGTQHPNGIGMLLLLSSPFAFYQALRYKKHDWLYVTLGVLQFFAIFLTSSRGSLLAGMIIYPIMLIYTAVKIEDKRKFLLTLLGCLFVLLCVYACNIEEFNLYFKSEILREDIAPNAVIVVGDKDLNDFSSNRIELYKEAWQVFKQHPIFGTNLGYFGTVFEGTKLGTYFFHSTFFQIIASLGIVGLVGYLYNYIYKLFFIVLKDIKNRPFNFFIFLALLGFEGYSMIDCGVFIPFPFITMEIFMFMVVERLNESKPDNSTVDKEMYLTIE